MSLNPMLPLFLQDVLYYELPSVNNNAKNREYFFISSVSGEIMLKKSLTRDADKDPSFTVCNSVCKCLFWGHKMISLFIWGLEVL